MQTIKAIFKNAWPYQKDMLNLPVKNLELSLPFYETVMGFKLVSKVSAPYKLAILDRDGIQIGLGENGGDPEQDGCFFEVDDLNLALEEFKLSGFQKEIPPVKKEQHGTTSWNVFYIIAPDGLCYCIGQRQG